MVCCARLPRLSADFSVKPLVSMSGCAALLAAAVGWGAAAGGGALTATGGVDAAGGALCPIPPRLTEDSSEEAGGAVRPD